MYFCRCFRVVANARKIQRVFLNAPVKSTTFAGVAVFIMKRLNLEGQRFGKLTVLNALSEKIGGRVFWNCKCDCGNITKVSTNNLRSGAVRSCGCLIKETASIVNSKHKQRGTRLYVIWVDMRRRCRNKNRVEYPYYGGRGITVCDEWDKDFVSFYNWAMTNGYNDNLSIDRIDNNKGYSPENCRWVDNFTQNNNRRNNHYVTINKKTKTITEWCRFYGNNTQMVLERIKRGWDEIKAIQTPQLRFSKYSRKNAKF